MVVTSIIRQNKKRTKVYIDNNYSFSADYEDIKKLGIDDGRIIDNNELKDLIYECQYNKAYNKVLSLLSMRSRTEYELVKKLEGHDYDKMVIDQVITRIKEQGYVNDAEYSKMWVEARRRMKPAGKKKLITELCGIGIDQKLATEAVDECKLDDFETAIVILNKRYRIKEHSISNSSEYSKIHRYLLYRGIGYNTASKAIKLFFKNSSDDYFD